MERKATDPSSGAASQTESNLWRNSVSLPGFLSRELWEQFSTRTASAEWCEKMQDKDEMQLLPRVRGGTRLLKNSIEETKERVVRLLNV